MKKMLTYLPICTYTYKVFERNHYWYGYKNYEQSTTFNTYLLSLYNTKISINYIYNQSNKYNSHNQEINKSFVECIRTRDDFVIETYSIRKVPKSGDYYRG